MHKKRREMQNETASLFFVARTSSTADAVPLLLKGEGTVGHKYQITDKKSNRRGELRSPVLPSAKFYTK